MNRFLSRVAALALLSGLFLVVALPAAAEEELSVQLYKKNVNSVVVIHAVESKQVGDKILTSIGRGSGSLIDAKKRLVLTNWHVVDELKRVWVDFPIYLKDGTMFQDPKKYRERAEKKQAIPAKVLVRDKSRDLAVIQLESGLPTHARALPLARKSITSGEQTWNLGSPGAVPQLFSITSGQVRTVGQGSMLVRGGEDVFEVKAKVVTATNPTNPGDSGGPLIDKRGYQIAVTQSGFGGTVQQVNSFIDVEEVRAFLKQNKIEIEELTPPEGGTASVSTEPMKDAGPAPKAGLTPTGASPEDEKAARTMLEAAKKFAGEDGLKSVYNRRLEEILKKYPETAAAKEAKKILGR
ncbi:MAG TPA: serine protease [Gemmataceae bacterium]|jgi:S1-C subfamily serine protease|nr:serine protease [Gemmataceae bacterium]